MSEGEHLTQKDLEDVLQSLAARLNAQNGEDAFAQRLFRPVRWQHFHFTHQYLADRLTWEADHAFLDILCGDAATDRMRELWLAEGARVKYR